MSTHQDTGWIYVLDNNLGHYKIGRAEVLDKRIRQLKIQLPFPVNIAYCFQTRHHKQVESDLHKHFKHRRLNGEWFELDFEDFVYITELAQCSGYYELPSGELVRDRFFDVPDPAQEPPQPEMTLAEWIEEHIEELDIEDAQYQYEEFLRRQISREDISPADRAEFEVMLADARNRADERESLRQEVCGG
jgi:hypothetical protein